MKNMNEKKKEIAELIAAILLEFIILISILTLQNKFLINFPLSVRAVLLIMVPWVLLSVPIVFMLKRGEKLEDIGYSKSNLIMQLLTGIILAVIMSFLLTVLPIMAGLKDMVGSTTYTKAWQFLYQFFYMIFGIALVEEFFYRGFLFRRLMEIKGSKWFAIIVSSTIFGLSHIFNGSILQVFMTALLGIFLCICRDKIKNCTTFSLTVAHGIHNALITLFVAIL